MFDAVALSSEYPTVGLRRRRRAELMKITTFGERQVVRVERHEDLPRVLLKMNLASPRRVLVSVGGAGGMATETLQAISGFLTQHLVPLLDQCRVAVVDGGTDAGVMRAMGQARQARAARFPLIGVAAEGTVIMSDAPQLAGELARLEPNHTHTVLVPGRSWGDESAWLSDLASAMSGNAPSVTLLMNGGEVSFDDAARSLESSRPLLVLAGTGRTADAIVEAARGEGGDARAQAIAASPLTHVVPLAHPRAVVHAAADALGMPLR